MADTNHPFDLLEPGIGVVALGNTGSAAEVSAAISLKRIADAVERLAPGGKLHPNFLSEAAFNAGRAFEEGRER